MRPRESVGKVVSMHLVRAVHRDPGEPAPSLCALFTSQEKLVHRRKNREKRLKQERVCFRLARSSGEKQREREGTRKKK